MSNVFQDQLTLKDFIGHLGGIVVIFIIGISSAWIKHGEKLTDHFNEQFWGTFSEESELLSETTILFNLPSVKITPGTEFKFDFSPTVKDGYQISELKSTSRRSVGSQLSGEVLSIRGLTEGSSSVTINFQDNLFPLTRTVNVQVSSKQDIFPSQAFSKISSPSTSPPITIDFSPFKIHQFDSENLPIPNFELSSPSSSEITLTFLKNHGTSKVNLLLETPEQIIYPFSFLIKTSNPEELPLAREVEDELSRLSKKTKEAEGEILSIGLKEKSVLRDFRIYAKSENRDKKPASRKFDPKSITMEDMDGMIKKTGKCDDKGFTPKILYHHKHRRWNGSFFGNITHLSPTERFTLHRIDFDVKNLITPLYPYHGSDWFCETLQEYARKDDKMFFPTFKGGWDFDSQCFDRKWREKGLSYDPKKSSTPISEKEMHTYYEDAFNDEKSQIHMITAEDVIIRGDVAWSCGEQIYFAETCNKASSFIMKDPEMSSTLDVDKLFYVNQEFGFTHFILEQLPRLAFFIYFLKENPDIKICFGHDEDPVKEWMEFLGLKKNQVLICKNTMVRARKAWIPEFTPCGVPRRFPQLQLNDYLEKEVLPRQGMSRVAWADRHILLLRRTRSTTIRRHIDGWEGLLQSLISRFPDDKVEIHDDAEMRMEKWVPLYANAKAVIGVYGGGLGNMVWCERGTAIIQVGVANYGHEFLRQASGLGHRFFGYVTPHKWNLTVDATELTDIVYWMLESGDVSKNEN